MIFDPLNLSICNIGGSEPPMPRRCRGQYDPLRIFVGGIPTDIGNGTQDLKFQILVIIYESKKMHPKMLRK